MAIHLPDPVPRSSTGKSVPVVQTIPYRGGYWSGTEMLQWGRTLESPPGTFGLGGAGVVAGVFENAKSWGPPKAYTLSLAVLNQQPAAVVNRGVIRAVINAGTGAGRETFEVDWRNGVSIGINAGNLTVTARQDGLYAHSVTLGATLAEGASLARSTPPTWSFPWFTLLAAGVQRVPIPRRARTVRVLSQRGSLTQVRVDALQVAGALFTILDTWSLPAEQALRTGVELPTWATDIEVTAIGVPFLPGSVEFGLDC